MYCPICTSRHSCPLVKNNIWKKLELQRALAELIGEFSCKLGFKGTPTSITASRFLMHGGNKNKHAHTHTHRWPGEGRAGVRSALRRMRALGFRRRSTRTSTLAVSQRAHSTPPRQSHTVVRSAPRCCQQLCLALPTGSVSRIRHAAGMTEKNPSR